MKLLTITIDPIIYFISILAVITIIIGFFLKKIKQPYIVGYIIIGAILGKNGLDLVQSPETIHHLGELGIVLLLFFIGMEISLPDLIKQWKVAVLGTFLQILISVLIIISIGFWFEWQMNRSIILGFVISLSSSAIIIKILETKNLINTKIGKSVFSILLMQDILVVPLLIITSVLGGEKEDTFDIILKIIGGFCLILILAYIYIKKQIKLPFSKTIENDNEFQVFLAIFLCFGGALFSSLFGLSPALGAFIGGMLIHVSKATDWIHNTLQSFRILFVAFFFISIGLQLNFNFIFKNFKELFLVLLLVYIINHFINYVVFRLFNCSKNDSLLGGAFMAQIGELSFLLSFSAYQLNVINEFTYNFTICLISLTLLLSPFWILLTERFFIKSNNHEI
ncbi:cation:proton antiporter [Aureivirga sp. CE67]|uniref:cation:proton antiporter domain-containing protein n=1 Tax=Aureivirga sp. CE67 TaxID=1788983 RepID=UPI0018CBC246|nr:cation:proton antiporter [Aureivirga sp. CE67]